MATLTLEIPDHTGDQLKHLADQRDVAVGTLIEQLAASALVEFDVETRFLIRARRGDLAHQVAHVEQEDPTARHSPGCENGTP